MKTGDSFSRKNDDLLVNGKRVGKITGYDATTGTLTYKFTWWRRLWNKLRRNK